MRRRSNIPEFSDGVCLLIMNKFELNTELCVTLMPAEEFAYN